MYHYEIADDFTKLFFSYAKKMMKNSRMHEDTSISPENIYQIAHTENRDLLFEIVKKSHKEGSAILGIDNLKKLYQLAKEGHSCLILSEHLSNLDVPSMFVRFYDQDDEELKEIFEKIIFIAGVKLNETPLVKLYSEMFTRVVIFPIRSLSSMEDNEENRGKIKLAKQINIRSTRKIRELRTQGNIFVMFPAGTRYRPWKPETKRGIKEAASYLKSFDYFCCASINGNNMVPVEHEDMTKETFREDVFVLNYGEVQSTAEYINKMTINLDKDVFDDKEKKKQIIVDGIMKDIDALHDLTEEYRKKFL